MCFVAPSRIKGFFFLLVIFLFFTQMSCGKKANPVIPVKVLPKGVEDLRFQVRGKSLVVSWLIPNENTDGSPLTDLKAFKFLIGQWATKDFCTSCPDKFQETRIIDPKGPRMPDLAIGPDRVEVVFPTLQPGQTYSFQVTVLTKKETFSAPSKTLRVAWDLPLTPPVELGVKPNEQGLEISWEAPRSLVDGSLPQGLIGYSLYRRTGKGSWVKVNTEPIKSLKYVDGNLQEGVAYAYQVKALRQVQGTVLESEGSEEKSLVFIRTGPPPVIEELLGVINTSGIELRWQRIENVSVSGYYVYRRSDQETSPKRISVEVVKDTSYQDRQVVPGTRYHYSVSVVGSSPGLKEGPKSKEIEITYNP